MSIKNIERNYKIMWLYLEKQILNSKELPPIGIKVFLNQMTEIEEKDCNGELVQFEIDEIYEWIKKYAKEENYEEVIRLAHLMVELKLKRLNK